MPIPRLQASPVLALKNIDAMSLPHVVMSYHMSHPTHAITISPKTMGNSQILGKRRRTYRLTVDVAVGSILFEFPFLLFLAWNIKRIVTPMAKMTSKADNSKDNIGARAPAVLFSLLLSYSLNEFEVITATMKCRIAWDDEKKSAES